VGNYTPAVRELHLARRAVLQLELRGVGGGGCGEGSGSGAEPGEDRGGGWCHPSGSGARLPPRPLPWAEEALRVPSLLTRPAVWKGLCTAALQVRRELDHSRTLSARAGGRKHVCSTGFILE
jgi:hypothetical protein